MTTKSGIDQDAIVTMFAEASARQGEALRKGVAEATLKALQGRELTLSSVKKVVRSVTEAASLGAMRNAAPNVDVEGLLGNALAGMDAALLRAVDANRTALEQFMGRGVALTEKPMRDALAGIEKMEDVFFSAVAKSGQAAGPMQAGWERALSAMKLSGSETGHRAASTVESLMEQARTSLRASRATGLRAAEAMLQSYAAMVSGVLIGMSEGMRAGGAAAKTAPASNAPATAAPSAASSSTAAPRKTAKRAARKRAG